MCKVADICGVSRSSVSRIAQEDGVNKRSLRPASRKGHPTKLTERQKHLIIRSIIMLRTEEGNFSAVHIMEQAGICDIAEVSVRTLTDSRTKKAITIFTSTKERACKKR